MKKSEIREILKNFNESMNAELGTIRELDDRGRIIPGTERKASATDYVEFYQEEWLNTVEKLAEAGLDIEEEEWLSKITINVQSEIDPDITPEDLKKGNFKIKATPNGKKSFVVKILKH